MDQWLYIAFRNKIATIKGEKCIKEKSELIMSIITPWNLSLLLKLNDFVEVSSSKELVR
jgi:hypothetical protein